MNTFTPFAIISARLDRAPDGVNDWRQDRLLVDLWRAVAPDGEQSIVETRGQYNGVKERGWLVWLPAGDDSPLCDTLRTLGQRYGQTCILYVDANRGAHLLYMDGHEQYIGNWREVQYYDSARRAPGIPNYSEVDGRYFVADFKNAHEVKRA